MENQRFPTGFSWNLKSCYLKINASCEVSRKFHHISQIATPAKEFALGHHFAQPCQYHSQKTRNTTRLKCCTCNAKCSWTRPKCCACHKKWNSCCENVAKVLRPATQNDFRHVTKHVHMSQSATPATRNEATSHLKPLKMTLVQNFLIYKYIYII